MLRTKSKLLIMTLTVFFLSTFVFISCNDDDDIASAEGSGTISMKVADDPFPIEFVSRAEITVDKIEMRNKSEANSDNGSKYYVILEEPITINLINYRNGLTAELPNAVVSAGSYDQIRLYVSDAEIELTNGATYDLTVPSGASSGLKVFINPALQVNADVTYDVLLDVDLTKSFVVQGNGDTPAGINGFHFKPVIRAINLSNAGTIYGSVSDNEGNALSNVHIWVEKDSVVSSTYTEIDGSYRIIGLPSGNYDVYAEFTGFISGSVDNVSVSSSSESEVNFQLTP